MQDRVQNFIENIKNSIRKEDTDLKRKDDIKEFSDRLARDNHWFTEENIGKLKKKFPYNSWLELTASEISDERDLVNKFILKNL